MRDFLMAGIVSVTVGTLLIPFIRSLAVRVGFVDRPDRHHKRHSRIIPLGGGIVVFLGAVVGLASTAWVSSIVPSLMWRDVPLMCGFVISSLTLILIGIIDDRKGMRGRHKLVGQVVAALLLISQGLEIRELEVLGWTIDLGVLSVPFTLIWLLGAINAVNLLDGIDGMSGTVGLTTFLIVACISIVSGQPLSALLAVALAGGCAAFLYANLPPAKMFLGDTGSMFLGLMVGALTVISCSKGPGLLALAPAVAVLAIPILDSTFALLRRRLTGRSIYMTDRGHLHHCLLYALVSHHAVLAVVAVACFASGSGAVIALFTKNDIPAILSTLLVVLTFILLRLFGYVECSLLASKLKLFFTGALRRKAGTAKGLAACNAIVRLQGNRQWNVLWEALTESAEKLQLLRVGLDINLPAIKESFHANWYQPSGREKHECWHIELPLFIGGIAVGRLDVSGEGDQSEDSGCVAIDGLLTLLGPFERAFTEFAVAPAPPWNMTGLNGEFQNPPPRRAERHVVVPVPRPMAALSLPTNP